jgi:hypothetical protein
VFFLVLTALVWHVVGVVSWNAMTPLLMMGDDRDDGDPKSKNIDDTATTATIFVVVAALLFLHSIMISIKLLCRQCCFPVDNAVVPDKIVDCRRGRRHYGRTKKEEEGNW